MILMTALGLAAAAAPPGPAPVAAPASSPEVAVPAALPASHPPIKIEMTSPPAPLRRDWLVPFISGVFSFLGSMLVLVAALGNTSRTLKAGQKASEALIHQKANEAELASINSRLNDFYGPYLQRSEENRLLIEELRTRQPNPEAFRTLTALQDTAWKKSLTVADRTLVAEIVANGEALRELIQTKAGMADAAVQDHFARAATHFRLLSLAKAGSIRDPVRFAPYVYPRELDGALRSAIAHLEARARLLRSKPSEPHGPAETLVLGPEHLLAPLPGARDEG